MPRAFRLAVFCAIAPLLIGTLIFLAFVLTGQSFLIALGLWTMVGGLISVTAGFAFLVCHLQDESTHPNRWTVNRPGASERGVARGA